MVVRRRTGIIAVIPKKVWLYFPVWWPLVLFLAIVIQGNLFLPNWFKVAVNRSTLWGRESSAVNSMFASEAEKAFAMQWDSFWENEYQTHRAEVPHYDTLALRTLIIPWFLVTPVIVWVRRKEILYDAIMDSPNHRYCDSSSSPVDSLE